MRQSAAGCNAKWPAWHCNSQKNSQEEAAGQNTLRHSPSSDHASLDQFYCAACLRLVDVGSCAPKRGDKDAPPAYWAMVPVTAWQLRDWMGWQAFLPTPWMPAPSLVSRCLCCQSCRCGGSGSDIALQYAWATVTPNGKTVGQLLCLPCRKPAAKNAEQCRTIHLAVNLTGPRLNNTLQHGRRAWAFNKIRRRATDKHGIT